MAVAEGAGQRTYYATLGSYPRAQGCITTAADTCGRERTSAACSFGESTGYGGGERLDQIKKAWVRTHLSHVTVLFQGRGTAAHICGFRPLAAVLLCPPRGRAPASGENGWRIRSEIKKPQSSAHEDIPWFASRPHYRRFVLGLSRLHAPSDCLCRVDRMIMLCIVTYVDGCNENGLTTIV